MNPRSTRTIRPVSCVAVVCVTAVVFGILPWPGPSILPAALAQQTGAGKKQKKDSAKGQEKKDSRQTAKPSTRAGRGNRGQESGARQAVPAMDPDFEKRLREIADSEAARVAQKQRARRGGKAAQRLRGGEVKPFRTPRVPGAAGRGAKIPATRSADGRDIGTADGPTTTLNIPPVDDGIAPEDRTYTFSIKDGTYEELVEGFARQTGLGVIGSAPKDGKVVFVSTQELTFDEALARVQMLLFKYRPHEPYWLKRRETHLEVIRVTDLTRLLPVSLMFSSVEEFAAAGLPDNELALVIYTPKSGSLSDLKVVRDFMPDYVRVTPLDDGSSVTIFALVKDINKYLELVPLFVGRKGDPRTIEKIKIEHILPSDAVDQLGQLMDRSGSTRVRPTGRRSKEISPLDTLRDPEVTLLPIDAQGVVIIRAMQDRIEEIKQLLPYIDVDARAGGLQPVVIEVENADAGELISTIHQIMAAAVATAEVSTGTKTPRRSPRRTSTPSTSTPATLGRLTLLLHPSKSAIIVVTDDDEELQYVRRLVKEFDVPDQKLEGVRIGLVHAEAAEMTSTIKLVFAPPKGSLEQFRIAADPAGDAIWFTGSQKDLERIRELVETMDRPDQAVSLHIVTLRRQPATLVASILREYEASTAGGATGRRRLPGVKPRPAAASKFTPNDDQSRIFVLCTDAEWAEYQTLIHELDGLDEPPFFSRLEVAHLEPEAATEQLSSLMTAGPGKPSVRFIATDGAVLVMNASEAHLEDIRTLLAEIDRPTDIQQRIFEIKYRAPGDIRAAIEALLGAGDGGSASRRRPRPDAKGVLVSTTPGVTVIEAGHRLIVRATPDKMAEVAKLIGDLDVEEDDIQIKVFSEFPPDADIDALADRLRTLFPGAASPSRASSAAGRGAAGSTAQFLPQSAAGELVVIASRSLLPRIEQYLDVLANYIQSEEQIIEFIPVEHAYPDEIVSRIQPLLDLKVRQLLDRGTLGGGGAELGVAAAQRRARRPGASSEHYHIEADAVNDRIIIAAPVVLVEEVRELVRLFDTPPDAGMIFKSVELANADPPSMVNAIREMMGQRKLAAQRQPAGQSGPVVQPIGDRTLSIVQAPSGSAIVLHGLPKEVKQAADWIARLDAVSSRGRAIKVYQIEHADIKQLVELIMHVVDTPTPGPTLPRPRPRSGMETDEPLWELTKTWVGHQIYVQADFMAGTMLVAAREGKLAEIDVIVAQFNVEGTPVPRSRGTVPSFMYDLEYAEDAIEAEVTLEMLLEQFWQPRDELPEVDAALFGNYLIIRYPHAERFDEIREMIREHVDKRPKGWAERKKKAFAIPSGISATDTALWIRMNRPDLDIEIIDISRAEDNTFSVEVLKPYRQNKPDPCVLPLALLRAVEHAVPTVVGQQRGDKQAEDREGDAADADGVAEQGQPQPSADDLIRAAAASVRRGGRAEGAQGQSAAESKTSETTPADQKIKIYIDDTTGGLTIEGPSGLLEEVPDWFEELKEDIENLPRPPDFRVVRVRYIDVFTAAEVLEEMFNATRQQRQMVQQQQRAAQQRLRQQQQVAARQRQQQAAKGQQPDQQQRGQPRGQQPTATPQLPPTSVRIYPSPRDRTLILRADTSQYPAILELLATIDRPQPIDNKLKIFKLVKLNAADVEDLLTELLDLDAKRETTASKSSGSKRSPTRRAPQRRGPAGRLPRTLMQEMVSGVGALGVDPGDIKLSSNEAANTLIVMAPQVAVTFIGDIIDQLESEDMPERTAKHYELTHADAQELADYLTTHFEEKRLGTRRAEGGKGKSGTSSGSSFNTPSFVAYPRLNLLTALATQEQLEEVDDLVVRFDVTSEEDRWQDVALSHADAKVVADTLTSMFAAPPGGGASGGGAKKSKFVGDQGGRILFFSAPESLREDILATITKLEKEAEDDTMVRIIRLTHQEPGKIAEAIEAAYRGGKGGAEPVRFTVSGHDPSKLLFVKADDAMFAEIESLAKTLDQPGSFDFEFRIYPLQHANARQVHDVLTKLVKDYLGRLGGKKNIEPFSIEVDDRANALIVLGSPVVFGFLEENLPKIDNPAAAVGKPGFMMFSLKNADAEQVAQNIARLWSDKTLPEGETPPHAEANRALNVLIVRGTQAQLDEIKTEFIDPLETQGPRQREKTIKLTYANPSTVQDAIQQLFGAGRNPRDKVIAVPDFGSNSIIVSGSPQNLHRVEDLVAKLDTAESEQRAVHVIHVENVDAESVTQTLTEMFIRSMPTPAKGQAPPVSITALKGSKAVMVKCRNELFSEIEALVAKIDRGESVIGESVRIVQLLYSDAAEMHGALENYLKKPGGRTGELAGDVRISVLAQSNALVVSGSKEKVEQLESTIGMLDQAGEKGSLPQIIPLEHVTAGDIAASLQQMFTEGGARGGKRPPVIIADEARNNLLIRAGASDLTAIQSMVEQLDTEDQLPENFRLLQLAPGMNVNELAEKVSQTINESAGARRGKGRDVLSLSITPMPYNNVLMLGGSPSLFDDAERMVRTLEEMAPPGGKGLRIIRLGQVAGDDITRLIDRLRGDSDGGGRSRRPRSRPSRRPSGGR